MSEDSWSGSDSSSGSGSSSSSDDSSSSSNAWATAAGEILGNALNDLTESRPTTAGLSSGSGGTLLNPAIQALFQAGSGRPVTDPRSLVRRIAEAPRWYVATGLDGTLTGEAVSPADDHLRTAFTCPLAEGAAPRTWTLPRNQSVRLLRISADPPDGRNLEMSGRELARRLPADLPANLDGILFTHAGQPGLGLWRDDLSLLTQLADAHDLEQLLLHPGPGQLSALRTARWYLPAGKRKFRTVLWAFDELIRVCTHPDGGYEDDHPMQELSGATLFGQLAARDGFDGIAVASGMVSDYQQEDIRFGPGVLRGIAAGVDARLGAAPLPARTRAEIELWMEITAFPWKDREIVPVDEPPGAVQVRSSMASKWRPYETSVGAPERRGPTLGPVFTIGQPDARPGDLGEGQTKILCAGLLAQYLYQKGSWRGSRWFVSRDERIKAAKFASIAMELEKLLPDGKDQLPRRAILTIDGASFLRRRPEYGARSWITEMRARHHQTATHWLPSLR